MSRSGWKLLLVLSAAVVFMIYASNHLAANYADSGKTSRIMVTVGTELNKTGQIFLEAWRQVHQLLGERRDYVDDFDESLMRKRKDHITSACSLLKEDTGTIAKAAFPLTYYDSAKVLYCPVAKVASKFWARMLHVLNTDDHMSPFQFELAGHRYLRHQTKTMMGSKRIQYTQSLINSTFKFLFSRDPYKRIYSSYLDKFVSPNPTFWNMGETIVSSARESPSNKSSQCGHDVKFSELVKFLIANDPENYDRHFKPVSVKCDVCRINYDFIGKVETFKHDVLYFLNLTHVSEERVLFKDFAQENSIHYIIFNAQRAFEMKKRALKCVTDHGVLLRLWRILQIAGLIEKHDSYPLTPEESRLANLTTVINLLLNAYRRSTSGARSNSREAFLQAYSQVSLEDMEKLRLKYLKDFMLFDYDDRPDILFKRSSQLNQPFNSFDYFDILQRDS